MSDRVAIVGVGFTPPRALSPDQSYREMTFAAATRAYADASVTHREIDSFVSVCEDLHEGTSITDEYTPDQLGAVLRPVQTIAGDGIQGLATAFMLIRTGIADLVAVESHCKSSNILRHEEVLEMALDPVFERPLRLNPHYIAGLEMARFLQETGTTEDAVAQVAAKKRRQALRNPGAAVGAGPGGGGGPASPAGGRAAAGARDQPLRRRRRRPRPRFRGGGKARAQTGVDPRGRLDLGHPVAGVAVLGSRHLRRARSGDGVPDGRRGQSRPRDPLR